MSVGNAAISKGLVQEAIESVLNDNNRQHRLEFLEALEKTDGNWVQFLVTHGDLDNQAMHYFESKWLSTHWEGQPVKEIARQSLIAAIKMAERHPDTNEEHHLPIECWWMFAHDQEKFEVLLHLNEQRVSRIVRTPPPPTSRDDLFYTAKVDGKGGIVVERPSVSS